MHFFDNYPKYVEVQGNQIAYYHSGSGEPIVFVHGITTFSFIWRKIVPFFSDYKVFAHDLLGCGNSEKPLNKDFSLKSQAHLLKEFTNNLGLEKFHLVCHDVGGGVGQIFTVNYPNIVKSLTLINSVAFNFWPVQPIIAMRTPIMRQLAMASLDLGTFKLIVKRALYHKDKLTKELMDLFWFQMKTKEGRKGFLQFAKSLNNQNLMEIENEIRAIQKPVLIIRGDADVYLSKTISEKLHEAIKGSILEIIETAGHLAQEDEPEKIAKLIRKFIANAQ